MVERSILIEVGVACVVRAVSEHFRKFQHVVGVAALGSVSYVDIAVAVGFGQEVLLDAVTSDACGTVVGYVGPEVLGSRGIALVGKALFCDALEAGFSLMSAIAMKCCGFQKKPLRMAGGETCTKTKNFTYGIDASLRFEGCGGIGPPAPSVY